MALKGQRKLQSYKDASYFVDTVSERGGVLVASTYGSGAALDNASHVAAYAANPSGYQPLGVLVWDTVSVDLTRYPLNRYKSEDNIGKKFPIADKGWVLTNMTEGTITAGPAYLGHSGRIRSTIDNNIANSPLVGRTEGTVDEDGYVKYVFNLP